VNSMLLSVRCRPAYSVVSMQDPIYVGYMLLSGGVLAANLKGEIECVLQMGMEVRTT